MGRRPIKVESEVTDIKQFDRKIKISKFNKEYFDYYRYERPETERNCKILNSIANVNFIPVDKYNAIMKQENPNFRPVKLPVETNPHHISHYIRSIAENRNIIENIKMVEDEHHPLGYKPSRPIIDINSTRILMGGIATEILMPDTCAADKERIRGVKSRIENFENKVNMLLHSTELDAVKTMLEEYQHNCKYRARVPDDNGYYAVEKPEFTNFETEYRNVITNNQRRNTYRVESWEGTLQEYMTRNEREQPVDPEYLINLTDVLYYIPVDDLYQIAHHLNDGVCMVGTVHVPKHLDTNKHFIQFSDKIEGYVQISPKKLDDNKATFKYSECKMFMKMNGNDDVYIHDINYLSFVKANLSACVIPCSTNNDFILKMVPVERYDCGATYYVRYKIIKISEPEAEDFITADYIDNEAGSYYTKFKELLDRELPYFMILKETEDIRNMIMNTRGEKETIANMTFRTMKQETALPKNKRIITQAFPKEAFMVDGQYYFTKTVRDPNNDIYNLRIKVNDTTQYIATIKEAVSPTLINKLVNKIVMMKNVDDVSIRSLITFIQKENPELNIPNQVIPLLAEVLYQTLQTEKNISALLQSNLTKTLNSFKSGEYKLEKYQTPEYTQWARIKMYIRSIFYTVPKTYDVNAEENPQGFH